MFVAALLNIQCKLRTYLIIACDWSLIVMNSLTIINLFCSFHVVLAPFSSSQSVTFLFTLTNLISVIFQLLFSVEKLIN